MLRAKLTMWRSLFSPTSSLGYLRFPVIPSECPLLLILYFSVIWLVRDTEIQISVTEIIYH